MANHVPALPTFLTCLIFWIFLPQIYGWREDNVSCRDAWVYRSSLQHFKRLTCAKCFTQVFFDSKKLRFNALLSDVWPPEPPYLLIDVENPNVTYAPDVDSTEVCAAAYLTDDECRTWKQCCHEAVFCCTNMQQQKGTHGCPATWDGISCWPSTKSAHVIYKDCPSYYVAPAVVWRSPIATKYCDSNGSWEVHEEHGLETTDYTQCFDTTLNIYILRIALCIDFAGNSISVLALAVAIVLVSLTRRLRNDQLSKDSQLMHINLFVAVMCTGASVIPMHYLYLEGMENQQEAIYIQNPAWCRMVYAISHYFRSTVYMSMFCEGLYLYRRIARMMYVNLRDPVLKYIIFTWGLPAVTVTIYVIVHVSNTKYNQKCWMEESFELEFIHMVPNILALMANVFFLASIEYNLCTSMRSDTSDRRIHMLRQALRASLSLVPVFGLQFIFLCYRPRYWPPYEVISAIFSSTQGLLVSVLYCFSKAEIRQTVFSRCRHGRHEYAAPPIVAAPEPPSERHLVGGRGKKWLCAWARHSKDENGLPDVVLRDFPGRKLSNMSQNMGYTRTTSVCSTASCYSSHQPNEASESTVAHRLQPTKVTTQELRPPGQAWRKSSLGKDTLSVNDVTQHLVESTDEDNLSDSVLRPIINCTTPSDVIGNT